jgi:hypothetical protein
MFASKKLIDKEGQEIISVTNNLFMNFIFDPCRNAFISSRFFIFVNSSCRRTRQNDI